MGNQASAFADGDSVKPQSLSERTLDAVAEYINAGGAKRIVVMAGAGISTSAGIPDFRSPKTGLYANLKRLDLPCAEAVFDISYFREHPEPFYYLAKELYPGNFHPTISHVFMSLLEKKGLLSVLFTQNIDCLERAAGVTSEKIVEAHGSFATQRCIECKTEFPLEDMKRMVEEGNVPHCVIEACRGLVKPDIVFFGEPLPSLFDEKCHEVAKADLVLIMGTSLKVYPFGVLPEMADRRVPRILFNLERVGHLGMRADDVLFLGPCDTGIRKLAEALGWLDELEDLWKGLVGEEEAVKQLGRAVPDSDEIIDEMQQLRETLEAKLNLESRAGKMQALGTAAAVGDDTDSDGDDNEHLTLHNAILTYKIGDRASSDESWKEASQRRISGSSEMEGKGDDILGGEEASDVKKPGEVLDEAIEKHLPVGGNDEKMDTTCTAVAIS